LYKIIVLKHKLLNIGICSTVKYTIEYMYKIITCRSDFLSQMVTYYLWWVLWYFKEFKNTKLDRWQKMLLSLRSNPQTMGPYIQKSDSLCTRTDHHMLLPIVLHIDEWYSAVLYDNNNLESTRRNYYSRVRGRLLI